MNEVTSGIKVPNPCWCCGAECFICEPGEAPDGCYYLTPRGFAVHWCEPCKFGGLLGGCFCGSGKVAGHPEWDTEPPPPPYDRRMVT